MMSPEGPVALPSGAVARGTVSAPPSKSHAIRALVCAALGEPGPATIVLSRGPLPDDALAACRALAALGFEVEVEDDAVHVVVPDGGLPQDDAEIDVGGSATAMRIFAAVAALRRGTTRITGTPQLLRRPAGAVVEALRRVGAHVETADGGRPPIVVRGGTLRGGEVVVEASESSHALSAMLLIAPRVPGGLRVRAAGTIASRPYAVLTADVMRRCGAVVTEVAGGWDVPEGTYPDASGQWVEGDWSSAAFLLGAAAATDGAVEVEGLDEHSAQADRRVLDVLRAFGADARAALDLARCEGRVRTPADLDLGDAPDLAPLAGALACLVPGTTRVRGAAHLRVKETDRIAEIVRCARALGCAARETPDGFEIDGGTARGARIDPAGDHRLAMAFAAAGLGVPGTRIAEPECVAKSYPEFWSDLRDVTSGESA